MNELAMTGRQPRRRALLLLWMLFAAAVVLVFVAANAHLIYVAAMSQPACVTHLKHGQGDAARGQFSAAVSSCAPPAVPHSPATD
ncbi:hypothetical protein [Bradyrhizobium sp. CCBAU 51753]|uniref:hypothetical protein n=1 Tax=Bradyrhizobium sp. CCBAU 51753 TaxID=1325100 RepID=UPI001FED8DFA|nr:hypothetical protein [Bradyrhizobium sp. CCBAU 51753]